MYKRQAVYLDSGEEFGVVKDVMETGANDVYVLECREMKKEILIPAIKECILDVDVENGKMKIHLLEGLLDL